MSMDLMLRRNLTRVRPLLPSVCERVALQAAPKFNGGASQVSTLLIMFDLIPRYKTYQSLPFLEESFTRQR